jgi:hypothetical protein
LLTEPGKSALGAIEIAADLRARRIVRAALDTATAARVEFFWIAGSSMPGTMRHAVQSPHSRPETSGPQFLPNPDGQRRQPPFHGKQSGRIVSILHVQLNAEFSRGLVFVQAGVAAASDRASRTFAVGRSLRRVLQEGGSGNGPPCDRPIDSAALIPTVRSNYSPALSFQSPPTQCWELARSPRSVLRS